MSFDEKHIGRENRPFVHAQNMADLWVKNGKALQQSAGQILYITQQGAVVVNKEGQVITAYTSQYFDTNMVDVVKQLFGN